jgi:predicted Zn finger-like uncharacterized protein
MEVSPVRVECPSCQKRLRVPASAAGKKVRCPDCGTAVPVPAAGSDAPPVVVVHPVPLPPADPNAFDFDDAPVAPAPAPIELPDEDESTECVLCGADEADETFYLCTQNTQTGGVGTVTKWINYPARCCADCHRTVAGLQTAVTVLTFAIVAAIGLAVGAGILYGNKKLPGYAIGIASIPLVAVIVANCVVWWRRSLLIGRRTLIPTLKRARAAFFKATKIRDVTFVPLASIKGDALDLER